MRNLSAADSWEADFITDLSKVEQDLHKNLRDSSAFQDKYAKYVKSVKCQDDASEAMAEKIYNEFDVLTLPTTDAVERDVTSWYRHMEESLIALGARYIKAGATINGAKAEEQKATVSQHLVSTQDRLEDYGTQIDKATYAHIEALSKQLRSKPYCS